MHPHAVPMSADSYSRVPEMLRGHDIGVELYRDVGEFQMLRCVHGDVGVLLSMTRPAHWAAASDERRDKVMVAAVGESLFRFWRLGRENRLCREIIALLQPLRWQPTGSN